MNLLTSTHGSAKSFNTVDELDDMPWQDESPAPPRHATQAPSFDWLFWAYFLCTAVAAFPLLGLRWSTPGMPVRPSEVQEAVLLSIPVMAPLPFLFLACALLLIWRPGSRTFAACAAFTSALLLGVAALLTLME